MPKSHSSDIDRLIQLLARVPGLGPRSARRSVLHLLKKRENVMMPLAVALRDVAQNILICEICGNLDTQPRCHVCEDTRRDKSKICVVEDVVDLWALDRSEVYKGDYHVLGGTLSALDGIMPEDLNISKLLERAASPDVTEVILALNATVDGQTTSHYLSDRLADHAITITALAHGLPVGGELDYLDDGTLMAALRSRAEIKA